MSNVLRPRRVAALAASVACLAALGTAGPAAAQSNGEPVLDLQAVICEPEGSVLRPTGFCEVPGEVEDTSVNPYTEDGKSPGILGLKIGGIL